MDRTTKKCSWILVFEELQFTLLCTLSMQDNADKTKYCEGERKMLSFENASGFEMTALRNTRCSV